MNHINTNIHDDTHTAHIQIDSDIPIPQRNPKAGGVGTVRIPRNAYRFADMRVGDSFLCKNRSQVQVSSAAHSWAIYQSEPKPKFLTRVTPEGVRCWRTS